MHGSYRTARIVETRNLFLSRLAHCVRMVEQEDRGLVRRTACRRYSPVNAARWLLPLNLPRRGLNVLAIAPVAVFDSQDIAA
jgi:hypothetical protein